MSETPQAGHNSFAADQLESIVNRIENLEAAKAEVASDIKDVFTEAGGQGYDVKALRMIIRLRKQDAAERQQFDGVLDTYKAALGMD